MGTAACTGNIPLLNPKETAAAKRPSWRRVILSFRAEFSHLDGAPLEGEDDLGRHSKNPIE